MSRSLRVLLLLVLVVGGGLYALSWLAGRYRALTPPKSVADVVVPGEASRRVEGAAETAPASAPAAPAEVPAAASSPESAPDAVSPAPRSAAPTAGAPAEAAVKDVDGFIAARRAFKAVVEAKSKAVDNALEQSKGKAVEKEMKYAPMHLGLFFELMRVRREALAGVGLSAERYAEIRSAWRELRAGREPADGAVASALRAREAALAEVDLGPREPVDELTPL